MIFRPYREADRAALERLHAQQGKETGEGYAFPDLEDPRYLRTFVAERDGEVVGAIVAHATVEVYFIGADPRIVRAAVRQRGSLERELLNAGADELHAWVPVGLLGKMGRALARLGFRRSNERWAGFYREL